jgi:cell division protein FtsQ
MRPQKNLNFTQGRNFSRISNDKSMPWSLRSALSLGFAIIFGSGLLGFLAGRQYLSFRNVMAFEIRTPVLHALSTILGLNLRYVEVSGLSRLSPQTVLSTIGSSAPIPLPLINIDALRRTLEAIPLIESTAIRVFYPDRLVFTVHERDIHALWQNAGSLYAIDDEGRILTPLRKAELDSFLLSLPYIIGSEAHRHVRDYETLINHAGLLKKQISAGIFVNQRRWTLKLKNGVDIYLPEKEAPLALELLSVLEQDHHILEKDIAVIDMRLPDRVTFRLTPRAVSEGLGLSGYGSHWRQTLRKKRNT